MEIGPINGIRMIPAVKAPPADALLPAVFDIAYTARAGDETYSGGEQSAGGQDDEESAELESVADEPEDRTAENLPSSGISLFA